MEEEIKMVKGRERERAIKIERGKREEKRK